MQWETPAQCNGHLPCWGEPGGLDPVGPRWLSEGERASSLGSVVVMLTVCPVRAGWWPWEAAQALCWGQRLPTPLPHPGRHTDPRLPFFEAVSPLGRCRPLQPLSLGQGCAWAHGLPGVTSRSSGGIWVPLLPEGWEPPLPIHPPFRQQSVSYVLRTCSRDRLTEGPPPVLPGSWVECRGPLRHHRVQTASFSRLKESHNESWNLRMPHFR